MPTSTGWWCPRLFDQHGQPIYGSKYPDIAGMAEAGTARLSGIAYSTDGGQYLEVAVTGGETISNVESSANLFSVLGVQPQIGRTFRQAEQMPGHTQVAVFSDAVWDKYFHRNPNALGKTIKLDGEIYTVIGVMPKTFSYPFSAGRGGVGVFAAEKQVWMPLPLTPDTLNRSGEPGYYAIIGRLKPGVSLAAAQTRTEQSATSDREGISGRLHLSGSGIGANSDISRYAYIEVSGHRC